MNILITGGGTGGHLAIAKTLAQELLSRGSKSFYVGSISGQDKEWFEDSNLFEKTYFLDTSGVVNKKGLSKLNSLYKQYLALKQAKKILKKHSIDAVFSVGGFSAGPASLACIFSRIPLFIHEQNAIKGTLNKLLSPFAKNIFGSFKHKGKNYIQTSYPIREEFFSKARIRSEIKTIIFMGGSQGAKAINDFALKTCLELLDRNIKIIHQCGKTDLCRVEEEYKKLGVLDKVELFDFSKTLVDKVSQADLAICRSGASSVWELASNGLCALFIPYPYAAKNHQYYNALEFTKDGLGMIVEQNKLNYNAHFNGCSVNTEENSLDYNILLDFIDKLNKSASLETISKKLQSKITPNGAKEIADKIINIK